MIYCRSSEPKNYKPKYDVQNYAVGSRPKPIVVSLSNYYYLIGHGNLKQLLGYNITNQRYWLILNLEIPLKLGL